ncbi:MAG TPA: hypothetical protein PLW65_13265, partial [Pseudomonadota bacterium]|nr:hypothetical protein [Pseudomonadota bacterium]
MPAVRATRGAGKSAGWLAAIPRALSWPARTRSYGVILTLTLTSLVVVALLHVWTRLEVIRIGYELSLQSRLHQALVQHNQRLRLELVEQVKQRRPAQVQVDGDAHRAQPGQREQDEQVLRVGRPHQRHALAAAQALGMQAGSPAAGACIEIGQREPPAAELAVGRVGRL